MHPERFCACKLSNHMQSKKGTKSAVINQTRFMATGSDSAVGLPLKSSSREILWPSRD